MYKLISVGNQVKSIDATGSFCCIELVTFTDLQNINDIQPEAFNAIDICNSMYIMNAIFYVFCHI
jgi:hypothetical protein